MKEGDVRCGKSHPDVCRANRGANPTTFTLYPLMDTLIGTDDKPLFEP